MSGHWLSLCVVQLSLCFITHAVDIDGGWNSWLSWTTCSVTCGSGYHVRSRMCDNPEPEDMGQNCTGLDFDTKPCDEPPCPIDGEWGSWDAWRGCTTTCGTGVTYRTRQCDNPAPQYNGANCTGVNRAFDKCFVRECPRDGGWTNWSDYGECSQTCGYDIYRSRVRNCTNPAPAYGGSDCAGNDTQNDLCEYVDCKDGSWEDWASWGACSTTCGNSVHFRFRNCSFSANNGSCIGNEYESGLCFSHCPVNGSWANWEQWSACSVTCEKGTSIRKRICANPTPQYGGYPCPNESNQTKACDTHTPCPIDGVWTSWETWSACDASCDGGYHVRTRRCSNPPPMYNGKICPGKDIEAEPCNTSPCPVNGSWSSWFTWTPCSSTCGTGTRSRFRTCTNPRPAHGGTYCEGNLEEAGSCTINPDVTNCTLDGGWSAWGSWGSCAVTCGNGLITRIRNCSNPAPHGAGKYCEGDGTDNKTCSATTPCPIDGGWSTWRDWFPCSASCGDGTETRIRTCSNPRPQHGGEYCVGEVDESRNCTAINACPGDMTLVG